MPYVHRKEPLQVEQSPEQKTQQIAPAQPQPENPAQTEASAPPENPAIPAPPPLAKRKPRKKGSVRPSSSSGRVRLRFGI